ncbi:MAG: 2-amino-4-oxopentanoate thiolase subunit OrtB [bacterium]|jgi:threonine dehydratase|nr:2-amino-4-oxopentanoate thiolase subunit OrtB [bacterium]
MNKVEALYAKKNEIMKKSVGIDYDKYEYGTLSFDYDLLMEEAGYTLSQIDQIQSIYGANHTPLKELLHINQLVKACSKEGYGARIFLKDEALNDSGSFKARRASIACYHAKKLGFRGVIAATSGNYGAAVASQAAKHGLKCIIVQECYDSLGIGQPEIIEKSRACEAYGAEVIQLSVGPELFYVFLQLLEETGYFNASLYTPYGIKGIETLGYECVQDCLALTNKVPDAIVVTNAGGGNVTGTARGVLQATQKKVQIIGASVNLKGLHMAKDTDFNKKSFTTGHTGFGIPFAINPDRSDVPRSAARPLRYLDRYVTVTQGQVFFMTEVLCLLEGIERGPAGNTSLAAAFAIAKEMKTDQIVVVQESEYTGAGKHHQAQLSFARNQGIHIAFGNPQEEIPGKSILLPNNLKDFTVQEIFLPDVRAQYLKTILGNQESIQEVDIAYLMAETKLTRQEVISYLEQHGIQWEETYAKQTISGR